LRQLWRSELRDGDLHGAGDVHDGGADLRDGRLRDDELRDHGRLRDDHGLLDGGDDRHDRDRNDVKVAKARDARRGWPLYL
jgi:hypothetical protein